MKRLLHKFATWLMMKTHEVTATEIMVLEMAKRPRKCAHCGLSPIHFIDKSCCKKKK